MKRLNVASRLSGLKERRLIRTFARALAISGISSSCFPVTSNTAVASNPRLTKLARGSTTATLVQATLQSTAVRSFTSVGVNNSEEPAAHSNSQKRRLVAWYAAPAFDLPTVVKILEERQQKLYDEIDASAKLEQKDAAVQSKEEAEELHRVKPPLRFTLYPPPQDGASAPGAQLVTQVHRKANKSASATTTTAGTTATTPNTSSAVQQTSSGSISSGGTGSGASVALPAATKLVLCCVTGYFSLMPSQPRKRMSFVFFADGGMVGWDAAWSDMVAMRKLVESAVPAGSTNTSMQLSLRTPLVESLSFDTFDNYKRRQLEQDNENLSENGSMHTGEVHSTDSHHAAHRREGSTHHFSNGGSPSAESLKESRTGISATIQLTPDPAGGDAFSVDTPEEDRNFVDAATDTVILSNDKDDRVKIAFSYALAQSVKLDAVDIAITPISVEVKAWQQALSTSGKLLCTVKKLRQAKTHTLTLLEYLNFKHHIQTTPKMFWTHDFQHLRHVFRQTCDHLEIPDRGAALKQKLDTVDGSVSYLHQEVHASSNEVLTWVIIILITAELLQALGLLKWAGLWILSFFSSPEAATPPAH